MLENLPVHLLDFRGGQNYKEGSKFSHVQKALPVAVNKTQRVFRLARESSVRHGIEDKGQVGPGRSAQKKTGVEARRRSIGVNIRDLVVNVTVEYDHMGIPDRRTTQYTPQAKNIEQIKTGANYGQIPFANMLVILGDECRVGGIA